jgi:VWFA-related protein
LVFLCGLSTANAQSQGPVVTITRVENRAFPQVTAYVAVSGENGSLAGLTAANFALTEDEAPIPAEAITVQSEAGQELRLVLAVDVSMPAETLAQAKAGATALLNTLSPRDRVAVILFQDQAKVEQDFTNNLEQLRAVIAGLAPAGSYTALNQATFDAVTLAGQTTEGRRAVIVLTDSKDNTGLRTDGEVAERAQRDKTSLWFIGLGDKIEEAALKTMSQQAGGQALALADPAEIEPTLLAMGTQLRQGYRVTFQSKLQADNAEHKLSVKVTHQGATGQAEAQFVALPGQIKVTLPAISEGQIVNGVITLTPQATASAPLVAAEYWLDETSLGKATAPPYSFEWDSAAALPGEHRLRVQVTDQAGNTGKAEVTVKVEQPLTVKLSATQSEVEVGAEIPLAAQIESTATIARVEFLLDGTVVSSAEAPPYTFALDSSTYTAGEHTLTLRVVDSAGRQAEDSVTLNFLAPPAVSEASKWMINGVVFIIAGLLVLVIILAALLTIRGIIKRQREALQKQCGLVIANEGNIRSRYELQIEDTALDTLLFQLRLGGVQLQPPSPREATQPVPVAVGSSRPVAPANGKPGGGSVSMPDTANAKKHIGETMKKANFVVDILTVFVSILPTSISAPFRGAVNSIRGGQTAVRSTEAQIKLKQQQVAPLTSLGGGKGEDAAKKAFSSFGKQQAPGMAAEDIPPPPQFTGRRGPTPARPKKVKPKPYLGLHPPVETPYVEPGQSLSLELLVDAVKPFHVQERAFTVMTRAVEQPEAPTAEQGQLKFGGLSWFRRYPPQLFVLLLAIVAIVGVGLLLAWWTSLEAFQVDFSSLPSLGELSPFKMKGA